MSHTSRNSDDWFHFYFRAWLESLFIENISGAAEGLYIRCLALQGLYRTIPADLPTLAKRIRRPLSYVRREWPSIASKFIQDPDDAAQLYNPELMAWRVARDTERAGKARGAAITNAKRDAKRTDSVTHQSDSKRDIRASYSDSYSASSSKKTKTVKQTTAPEPVDPVVQRLAERYGSARTKASGTKTLSETLDFYRGMMLSLLAGEGTEAAIDAVLDYLESPAGERAWQFGLTKGKVNYTHAFIATFAKLAVEAKAWRAGKSGNARGNGAGASEFQKGSTSTAPARSDEEYRRYMLEQRARLRGCTVEELEVEDTADSDGVELFQ